MENLWPEVDDLESTDDVLSFFNETSALIEKKYGGKIKSQLSPITFILKDLRGVSRFLDDIHRMNTPQQKDYQKVEVKNIEEGRKSVTVNGQNYKYEIYNDHLYFKLFTINIPEFYPLKLKAAWGTLGDEDVEIEINSIEHLRSVFGQIVNSNKVKMIIKKML